MVSNSNLLPFIPCYIIIRVVNFISELLLLIVPGGVMFKVFIVGEAIKVVRRFSLPNVSMREVLKNAGIYRFPRVSHAAASADDADLDPHVAG